MKQLTEDYVEFISDAYNRPSELFGFEIAGGVHGLGVKHTLSLIQILGVDCGDETWELGCGEGNLAFSMSAAADGATVVATDIGKIYPLQ